MRVDRLVKGVWVERTMTTVALTEEPTAQEKVRLPLDQIAIEEVQPIIKY